MTTPAEREQYRAIRKRVITYLTDDDPKHRRTYPRLTRALTAADGLSSPQFEITGIKGSRVTNMQEKRMLDLAEYRQAKRVVDQCIAATSGNGPAILEGLAAYERLSHIRARLFQRSANDWRHQVDQACYEFADALDVAATLYGISDNLLPPLLVA